MKKVIHQLIQPIQSWLKKEKKHYQLGMTGLANHLNTLLPHRLYMVFAMKGLARDSIFFEAIQRNLKIGAVVAVSDAKPEQVLKNLVLHNVMLDNQTTRKNLNIFSLPVDFVDLIKKFGIKAILNELESYHLPPQSICLLEGAEKLFQLQDRELLREQLKTLSRWFRERGHCGVLLCEPLADETQQLPVLAETWRGELAGMVELVEENQRQFLWKVEFWRTEDGVALGHDYPLLLNESGYLALDAFRPYFKYEENEKVAHDSEWVIATQIAVQDEAWLPPHWTTVANYEAILEKCQTLHTATVILHANRDQIQELAKTIYLLRKQSGKALKILVREGKHALRYHYELLLLRVGANLVVSQNPSFSRLASAIESLRGQLFQRSLPADLDGVLTAAMNSDVSGYVAVPQFIEHARVSISKSRELGLSQALIQLPLLPHIPILDALQLCVLSRSGDIVTAHRNQVYLFLFACRPSDIAGVLSRVFKQPVDSLFSGEIRGIDDLTMLEMVADLEQQLRSDPAVNYSELLQKQRESHATTQQAKSVDATPTVPAPVRQFPMLEHVFEPTLALAVNKELPKMMTKARPIDLSLRSENRQKQPESKTVEGGQKC